MALSKEQIEQELSAAQFVWKNGDYKNLDSSLTLACTPHNHECIASLKQIRRGYKCVACELETNLQTKEVVLADLPKKQGRRLLALDQATLITGFAIIENGQLIHKGIKRSTEPTIYERIKNMRDWLISVIKHYEIDVVGVEDIQLQQNVEIYKKLAMLYGVIQLTVLETTGQLAYTANSSEWCKWCGIKAKYRNARKEASQNRVKTKFGLTVSQDAADAINMADYFWSKDRMENLSGGWHAS